MTTRIKLDAKQFETHLDAAQSVFFARELEEIDARMYDTRYAELEAFQLVPAKPLNPGAESYTYRVFDSRGVAEITANYAKGSPRADVEGKEYTSKVRGIRASYGYNVQEIRAAQLAGRPLENARAVAARRAINERINRTALLGDATHGIVGLFNQPNALTYTIPAVGTGSSALWANKTGDQIADDIFGVIDFVPTQTAEVEKVKRLLMPYNRLRFIQRKRMGTDTNLTVLKYVQENRPDVEIRGALFLDTAGAGGTARMMGYNPMPECMELLLPVAFESFPPERAGLEWTVENHARMGGVVCRYPLSCVYADGF